MEKKTKKQNNLGFSLVEIIVVTSIVTLAFMGVMSLVRRTISLRSINHDSLVATQLAAEGIELVKNVRNENWLAQRDDMNFFYLNVGTPQPTTDCKWGNGETEYCYYFLIDYNARPGYDADLNELGRGKIDIFNSEGDAYLNFDMLKEPETQLNLVTDINERVFYSYQKVDEEKNPEIVSSVPTIFHRIMRTTLYPDYGGEGVGMLKVQAIVYWQNRGKDNYYNLTTELYDYDWYY